MGKGSNARPVDKERYDHNFERVFGAKPLNNWESTTEDDEEYNPDDDWDFDDDDDDWEEDDD